MSTAGTLELFAIELSKLLAPIEQDLAPARARGFFGQIGIQLSPGQVAALTGPLTTAVNRTSTLLTTIPQLMAAIEADNTAALATHLVQALTSVGQIVQGLDAIGAGVAPATTLSADQIARRIFDYLAFQYFDRSRPLNDLLELAGILEREDHDEDPLDPASEPFKIVTFRFNKIGDWLSNPATELRTLYGWGAAFDGRQLFSTIERIVARYGFPVLFDDTGPVPKLDLVVIEAMPKTDAAPPGLSIPLKADIASGVERFAFGSEAAIEFIAEFQPPLNTTLTLQPDGTIGFVPPGPGPSFGGDFRFRVIAEKKDPPEPFLLFGTAGQSRLDLKSLSAEAGARVTWNGSSASGAFAFGMLLDDLHLVVDASKGDGFLSTILRGVNVDANFDLAAGVSTDRGLYFSGSSALEVRVPAHIELGPVAIEALTIAAGLDAGRVPVSVGADIRASLGPMVAVVQNIGLRTTFAFAENNRGNLGPLQFDLEFKPPTGVGLSIDAGAIRGGGFLSLDAAKGEYFGALEFSFQNTITLKAIGIINTKMPDGSTGFALLILITAEFIPIQLGFGFTLLGVGGLLALNRTLDLEALRIGVRTGAVSSILFPQDVVANIRRIISDLDTIFPIAAGHFIVGPMGKIGWGTPALITLDLGIILDIPRPMFALVGILRCILPSEDADILRLQVNFAGGIDFEKGLLWFDASLYDSRLLLFTLTGDMALRIGWGDESIFVLSVGGFHPAFKEIPQDLRTMRRLGISLLSGDNPRLTVETYFAVTSNSVQNGAKAELYAEACGFNIYGFIGYDLLVQFNPFYFVAAIYAGFGLRSGTHVIAGIYVRLELSGPTPWRARGDGTLGLLFFEITVSFDVTWGEEAGQIEQTEDVYPLLRAAVLDDRNWTARLPANTHHTVTLRATDAAPARVLLHPFGLLAVSQKVVPLAFEINKFGNKRPAGLTRFDLSFPGGEEVREEFAVTNFVRMSDSEKLSRKSFERMRSGVQFTSTAAEHGARIQKDVTYELSYMVERGRVTIRAGLHHLMGTVFSMFSMGSAAARNAHAVTAKTGGTPPSKIDVRDTEYMVVNVSNLSLHESELVAKTQAEAYMLQEQLIAANPGLAGTIQVVSSDELA
jgi:hypothetical protein